MSRRSGEGARNPGIGARPCQQCDRQYHQQDDADAVANLRTLQGPERFIAATRVLRSLFPEWVSTIDEMIAEGDKVVTKCTVRGRDVGNFLGTGPEGGAEFELEQMIIQTFENGRIVKIYALSDELSFWRTLGAILPA